ncbi:MAG: T9SS type A sorting domain-containing protein [Bacteroidetes bacterium]|nr:T9SS type A sorting domain-containing protein [Bacteroidota bacterium]
MKKNTILLIVLPVMALINTIAANGQNTFERKTAATLFESLWNGKSGLSLKQGYDMNTGVLTFEMIDEDRIAFLDNATNRIRIFSVNRGKEVAAIKPDLLPVDFAYSDGLYYVLNSQSVEIFTESGKLTEVRKVPGSLLSVCGLKVINGSLYLLANDGNSVSLSGEQQSSFRGWIMEEDRFVKTEKRNRKQFTVRVFDRNGLLAYNTFDAGDGLATVRPVGISDDYIFLDAEYILSDIPLKVERKIFTVRLKSDELNDLSELCTLPDIYSIYLKHDLCVKNGELYYLLALPEGIRVYRLTETDGLSDKRVLPLPDDLYGWSYHFNEHLLPSPEQAFNGEGGNKKSILSPIYRDQIIANAEPYDTHVWTCGPENILDYDCGGVHVTTPSWVQVGTNVSLPYCWGGWTNLSQFDQGLLDGVSAGDCYTVGSGAGVSCAVGVDCSGFVSLAWELPWKYSTSSLPNISTAYAAYEELLPGDIVNYAGSHVRLVHTLNQDGSFLMIESSASGTNWSVGYATYTVSALQPNYIPRYYNDVINDPPDTTAPVTYVNYSEDWATADFTVIFSDSDNNAVDERFFLVSDFDGTEWRANGDKGFFNDHFDSVVHTDWTNLSGTWSITGSCLNQGDETLGNNNLYTGVVQETGNKYLYHWKMKISGSGTNRRGGIYFFCDDPTLTQRGNSYMVYYRADQNTCQIYKSTDDDIVLQTSDDCTVNADTWFDCKVIFDQAAGTIKAYKDNVLASEWTDPSPHVQGIAVSLRTGNCNMSYDDLRVYRSRAETETITIGAGNEVRYQNPGPSIPSCRITTLITDEAGNFSTVSETTVNIDWSPPDSITSVFDGAGADEDTTDSDNTLMANWAASTDVNSGIAGYMYAIGTQSCGTEVLDWISVGNTLSATALSLSLSQQVYYFSVKAVNGAGLESSCTCSDGILADTWVSMASCIKKEEIAVFPNPAGDLLFIETGIPAALELLDVRGRLILKEMKTKGLSKMELSGLTPGTYLLRAVTAGGVEVRKVVKE